MTFALADVLAVLGRLYGPSWAESWDAVGLMTRGPTQPVRRVRMAFYQFGEQASRPGP
ncbi:hypothetical protein [Kribbella deserti]|uniref:Uncharacterized protein n=1 Tax=Kribbella deserti TaxID=1926257 RepID=A0ABV6QCR6_9ACTN